MVENGVSIEEQKREVIQKIQELHHKRLPLNIAPVKREYPELIQIAFGMRPFWGWKQALEDAGLDYSKINIEVLDCCTCKICGYETIMLSTHLRKVHSINSEEYREEYPRAEVISEQRRAQALGRGKTLLGHWEPFWTPEYVLDRIREFHRRDLPLSRKALENEEKGFPAYACLVFKGWDDALSCAGLDPMEIRKRDVYISLSREEVIQELKKRYEKGESLASCDLNHEKGQGLRILNAGIKRFGSYVQALKAAEIDPAEVRKRIRSYTWEYHEEMFGEIRELGKLLGVPRAERARKIKAKYRLQVKSFRSWDYVASIVSIPSYRLSTFPYPTAEEVIQSLKLRYKRDQSIEEKDVVKEDPNLYRACLRFFRSQYWQAIREAKLPVPVISQETKKRGRYRTAQEVLDEIHRRQREGLGVKSSELEQKCKDGGDSALKDSGAYFFNSWPQALAAAGVEYSCGPSDLTKQKWEVAYPTPKDVLTAICKRHEQGLTLEYQKIDKKGDFWILSRMAKKYFGSYPQAVRAAGLELKPRAFHKYPDAEKVRSELVARKKRGASLISTDVIHSNSVNDRDPTLYLAAQQFFGGWREALQAADVEGEALSSVST